jgi:hypothetical protein
MGTHKTASTAFQSICTNSRKVLIDNGLVFPQYSNWSQHSVVAWAAQKRDVKHLRKFLRSIFEETKASNCEKTLISGEDFENFLVDTHLASEFEDLAKSEGYTNIEWIIVRRDPLDYLLSIYAEKSGYQMVLDLELMANLILEYGFVSPGGRRYNYKFIFDIKKFSELFKKNVNKNLTVIQFKDFTNDFVGKVFLKHYLGEKSLEIVRKASQEIGVQRKRPKPEKVEFRYVANFLGRKADKIFYENNKNLVDALVSERLNRNKALIVNIKNTFKARFG